MTRRSIIRRRVQAPLGVLYLCFGEMYKEFTALSMAHLRRQGYPGPIRVVTDSSGFDCSDELCEVIEVCDYGEGFASRHYKTQINQYGWDTTLFLDCDAIPIAPINHIWKELRSADICMCVDNYRDVQDLAERNTSDRERRSAEYRFTLSLGLARHTHFNSGVMLFRRTVETEQLFATWREEWSYFQHEDQLALVRALGRCACGVHTLAPRWNARVGWFGGLENARAAGARIVHLRHSREPVPPELLEVYS